MEGATDGDRGAGGGGAQTTTPAVVVEVQPMRRVQTHHTDRESLADAVGFTVRPYACGGEWMRCSYEALTLLPRTPTPTPLASMTDELTLTHLPSRTGLAHIAQGCGQDR
jgi:hypothetical protein